MQNKEKFNYDILDKVANSGGKTAVLLPKKTRKTLGNYLTAFGIGAMIITLVCLGPGKVGPLAIAS